MKYQPLKLTTAQTLLVAMGWDSDLLFGHHRVREAHPTKSGPGRRHAEGKDASRATARNRGGAGPGFVRHEATGAKTQRRLSVAKLGIRQHKRLTHASMKHLHF